MKALRDYLPRLAGQWWTFIGMVSGVIGYVVSVATDLKLPGWFWLGVFVLVLVVAQFRVYQRLWLATIPAAPQLPHWAAGATNAGGNGCWLTIVACGNPSRPWRSTGYADLKEEAGRFLGVDAEDIGGRAYQGGAEVKYPGGASVAEFRIQVESAVTAAVVIQTRTTEDPVMLGWLLESLVKLLGLLEQGPLPGFMAGDKDRWCRVGLSDWPAHGVDPSDLLPGVRRTNQNVLGYRLAREYKFGRKPDAWAIVVDFASHVLANSGVVDFEHLLTGLGPGVMQSNPPLPGA